MLVFIWKLLPSTLSWVPICQGFSHLLAFLHHFVLAKLATGSIRVNENLSKQGTYPDVLNEVPVEYSLDVDLFQA